MLGHIFKDNEGIYGYQYNIATTIYMTYIHWRRYLSQSTCFMRKICLIIELKFTENRPGFGGTVGLKKFFLGNNRNNTALTALCEGVTAAYTGLYRKTEPRHANTHWMKESTCCILSSGFFPPNSWQWSATNCGCNLSIFWRKKKIKSNQNETVRDDLINFE